MTKHPVTFTNRPEFVFEGNLDQRAVLVKVPPKTFADDEHSPQGDPDDEDGTQTPDEPENEPRVKIGNAEVAAKVTRPAVGKL